jgi:release factor glutamine methyltransferase
MSTGLKEDRMSAKQDEPWTVLRLLKWTTDFFQSRGSQSARLDAEVLLAHARGCQRIELYAAFNQEPTEEQRVAFREMVRRRGAGTPVAHLVGHKEFYSLQFRVDENTLIPRPETEHVVTEAIDFIKSISSEGRRIRVADVGTGSGVIAITIAKHSPSADVVAVDLSEAALGIAKWNAEKLEVIDRIQFFRSDLFNGVKQPTTFDLIVSNPPYVSRSEYESLDASVRNFEPAMALVCEDDGKQIIKRLLTETSDRLESGGRYIIELSPMIAEDCKKFAIETGSFSDVRLIKDLAGHQRVLVARKS